MKVRTKLKKYGTVRFTDHLDAMRYSQKAIHRSDVEICYSGGFNPCQIMSFVASLGVEITSNGEYMDTGVSGTEDPRAMISQLNQAMSEGLKIINFREFSDTAGNATSTVAAADYTIVFRSGYEPKDMSVEGWFGGLLAFYEQLEMVVTKKAKRGQAELDIRPLIYDLRLTRGEDENTALFMKISTGSSSSLKSELVLDVYYGHLNQEWTAFAFLVQGEEAHADLGGMSRKEEGNYISIPPEELGQEIL